MAASDHRRRLRIELEEDPDRQHQHQRAEEDDRQGQVAVGAATPPPASHRRDCRMSRSPAAIEATISGRARNRLMMPPAATAPAPM